MLIKNEISNICGTGAERVNVEPQYILRDRYTMEYTHNLMFVPHWMTTLNHTCFKSRDDN